MWVRCRSLDTERQRQYVVTKLEYHREGCLFNTMGFSEKVALRNHAFWRMIGQSSAFFFLLVQTLDCFGRVVS